MNIMLNNSMDTEALAGVFIGKIRSFSQKLYT